MRGRFSRTRRLLRSAPAWWLAVCVVVWVGAALGPVDTEAWMLEQVATVLCALCLAWVWPHVVFSRPAVFGLAVLFCMHTIGTHYTYSLTPYDAFLQKVSGVSLNGLLGWERNHYDRWVHFLWGLCLALPVKESLEQRYALPSRPANVLALTVVIATSAVYELLEWSAALVFGGDLGVHYLGTQGDVWDAQADIALGAAGWCAFYTMHLLRRWQVRRRRAR